MIIREVEILGTVKSMAFRRMVSDGQVYPVLDSFRKWLFCPGLCIEKLNEIQVRELIICSLEMRCRRAVIIAWTSEEPSCEII